MARDTAWSALSTRTPASAVLVDGLPVYQHASQRLTRANNRGRRLSSEASLVPAAVMRGDALCAPCIGTWARRKTASATRGMMRRWAARCPTSAPWEASGPPSHIHLRGLPHNDRGPHSPRDAGSWVVGRSCTRGVGVYAHVTAFATARCCRWGQRGTGAGPRTRVRAGWRPFAGLRDFLSPFARFLGVCPRVRHACVGAVGWRRTCTTVCTSPASPKAACAERASPAWRRREGEAERGWTTVVEGCLSRALHPWSRAGPWQRWSMRRRLQHIL